MKKTIKIIVIMILILSLNSCFSKKEEPVKNDNANIQKEINSPINNQDEVSKKNVETVKKIQNEMSDDMKDISQKMLDWKITDEEAKEAFLNSMDNSNTLKSQLEIQKEQMPKMLKIMKASLECVKDIDNKFDAKKCEDESKKLAKKLWIEDMYEDDEEYEWEQDKKAETISDIEKWITQLEKAIPCLEKAKVMTEFMECSNDFK